ncbi:hypothetical protein DPMN_033101 [Dreissena polymorpha]|uniref:Uncharacterized protein n=1 Tax=Dreissena polymorpha TaxID=45954 RepID=A0A9D4RIW0_DREPO|nr:hypothetical protein DPMN_033101 [Dreissena polymorpha]
MFCAAQDITRTKVLTKFHEQVPTRFNYSHTMFNFPPTCGHSVNKKTAQPTNQSTETIFELFHEHWTMDVASRLKNASPPGGNIFQFHEHRTINVLFNKRKMPRLPGGNVFQATETIFKLVQDMIGTYRLTKFHKDRKINVASRVLTRQHAPGPGGHVYIIGTKLLIKCHDDLTICVASRAKCPPVGGHIFQFQKQFQIRPKYQNLLTNVYKDWTIHVVIRV